MANARNKEKLVDPRDKALALRGATKDQLASHLRALSTEALRHCTRGEIEAELRRRINGNNHAV